VTTTVRNFADIAVPTNHHAPVGAIRATDHDISRRQAALIAGLGLLLLAVLAAVVNFGVFQNLIVPGDAQTTAQHIGAAQGLFRLAIAGFFGVAILDVVVGWALYIVFKPVNQSLSLLAAILRIVYATLLAIALNNLVSALQLLGGADYLNALGTDQLQAQMMVLLGAFQSGWDLALIIFGLHLSVVGVLVYASGRRIKILGVLVIAAGLGYMIDGIGKLLFPDYAVSVAMFTFVGEPLLMVWLLVQAARNSFTTRIPASLSSSTR
jgi:hypothetical protein